MRLNFNFPVSVRKLYLGHWACFLCGRNGSGVGGLEIHHILGRVSDSAFNSSCLCRRCHEKICHNRDEHRRIFLATYRFLRGIKYQPNDGDWAFLERHFGELVGPELTKELRS